MNSGTTFLTGPSTNNVVHTVQLYLMTHVIEILFHRKDGPRQGKELEEALGGAHQHLFVCEEDREDPEGQPHAGHR